MDIFTGAGLALPAGLNAYIPLLTVGLLARFTELVELDSPYDLLASNTGLITLAVLLLIEIFADAIPGVDHVNDVVQTVVRPAAGAIVMLAVEGNAIDTHPLVQVAIGVVLAGSVHGVKALGRPFVTGSTGGVGNPIVSTVENASAAVMSILAIVAPVLVLVVLVLLVVLGVRWWSRRRRRELARWRGNKVDIR